MKNYLTTKNNSEYTDLFNAFDEFFRPAESFAHDIRTDVKETESEYVISMALAGFDKNEIDVSLENGYLTVSAKKEKTEETEKYLRREILRQVSRSFYVGEAVRSEHITAKYENGILSLAVPKEKPEIKSGKIAID